jgi:uncharacterized protein
MADALRTLQQSFLAALRDESTELAWVGHADAARRVAVYRNAVQHNWQAAMTAVYPVCRAWVGPAFFNEAVRRHLAECPSRSGDLHDLGAGFADFLADYPPASTQALLPDLARLEWAVHRAFHAADSTPLTAAAMATVAADDLERLVLVPLPGTALLSSEWPILDIWKAHQHDAETALPAVESGLPGHVVVWREGFETALAPLNAAEACVLNQALAGRPLLDVLAQPAFSESSDAGTLLSQALQTMFELGLVGKLHCAQVDVPGSNKLDAAASHAVHNT